MKAAVYEGIDTLVVKEMPTPEPGGGGVLVKVNACAICGSDLRTFHNGNDRINPPTILGHEAAGEVVAVGKDVTKFAVGDRVALGADVPCGECEFCRAGYGNNCPINYAMGYQFAGSFAEYVLLNELVVTHGPVHHVPGHVRLEEAALAEPLACVLNALERSQVRLGDTCVVIGLGPLGCMICHMARRMGATRVIAVNRSRPRLERAKDLGADVCICSSEEDSVARVLDETKGLGAEVILTACPSPDAQVDAIRMAKSRGRVNFFGGLAKGGSQVTIDTNIIHYRELAILGAHGCQPRHHQDAVNLIAAGVIDMKSFITHRFPLEEAPQAFEAADSRTGMRVVIRP